MTKTTKWDGLFPTKTAYKFELKHNHGKWETLISIWFLLGHFGINLPKTRTPRVERGGVGGGGCRFNKFFLVGWLEAILFFCPYVLQWFVGEPFSLYIPQVIKRLSKSHFLSQEASVVMQRLSYPTETVLSNKITRNVIVLLLKDSLRKTATQERVSACAYYSPNISG